MPWSDLGPISNYTEYATFAELVEANLGRRASRYDVAGVVWACQVELNEILRESGIWLEDNTFHGPWLVPWDYEGEIARALKVVDVRRIARRHKLGMRFRTKVVLVLLVAVVVAVAVMAALHRFSMLGGGR